LTLETSAVGCGVCITFFDSDTHPFFVGVDKNVDVLEVEEVGEEEGGGEEDEDASGAQDGDAGEEVESS
jgi:hypothetical protein